jgi:hypothetical protein
VAVSVFHLCVLFSIVRVKCPFAFSVDQINLDHSTYAFEVEYEWHIDVCFMMLYELHILYTAE